MHSCVLFSSFMQSVNNFRKYLYFQVYLHQKLFLLFLIAAASVNFIFHDISSYQHLFAISENFVSVPEWINLFDIIITLVLVGCANFWHKGTHGCLACVPHSACLPMSLKKFQ